MPATNRDVATIFEELADLLEIQGANPFRVRAYRGAARTVSSLPRSVADLVSEGADLTELSGIGKDLAAKVTEIVDTGTLAQLTDLKKEVSPELAMMLRIPGLGPKRVATLRAELGIDTLEKLEEAAASGRIAHIEGFGQKTQQKILDGLAEAAEEEKRTTLAEADQVVQPYLAYLKRGPGIERLVVAGSYRRRRETVGDLDILATGSDGPRLIEHFVRYDSVKTVVSQGDTRSTVVLRSGMQVDLRVVPQTSYGAALLYFTGSKDHNVALRKRAVANSIKLNEYGAFREEKGGGTATRIAGETEEEIYALFGMPLIAPELRENRGELEAATTDGLPHLVTRADLQGDLHVHTTASDGKATLEQMVNKARELGYAYIAITDHAKYLGIYNGLDAERLARQAEAIDALNEQYPDIEILKGSEVDILEDGSLALADEALAALDVVVASVHTQFGLSRQQQTERIIRAMDNPHVHIIGHPTGRMLNQRAAYPVDMEQLVEAALERGVFIEINSQPARLDMSDIQAKMARDMGLLVPVNTDAHATHHLDFVRFGIDQARRGWLRKGDVLNTRTLKQLRSLLKR